MPINPNSSNINPITGLTEKEDFSGNMSFANKKYTSPYNAPSTAESERFEEDDFNEYQRLGVNVRPYSDNQEVRAENQSASEQLLSGLGKMAVLTGTTFADGTLGTIVGLGNMLTGGSFIDNPFSNAMQDLNEKSEKWMPNYYTKEGQEAFTGIVPFTEGSANFWGDKILKNFGFALGAYLSGLATAGIGGAMTERVLASRTAKAITNAMMTEGKSSTEISNMLKAFQAGDDVALDYMKKSQVFLDEIKSTANLSNKMSTANQWAGAIGGAIGESRVEAIGNSRVFKEQELAKLQEKYGNNIPESELQDLENRTNRYMNTTFGINMAILTLTDYAQFADAFKPKYSKLRSSLNTIEGSIETGFKAIPQSNLSKAWNLTKNPIYEGTQEQLQFATQKGGDEFYTKRYDENGKEITNNFIDSYIKGLSEAYTTAEGWEMFATGAIIGSLGMPNISKLTGRKGLVQGGIYGEYQEIRETEATTNKAVQDLNKATEDIKNNETLKDTYEHLARIATLSGEQKEALLKGDKFEYQNKEEDKLLSQVLAFYNAGKIEDLESYYDGLASKKGDDVRKANEVTKENGKKEDPFKGLTDSEIETYYKNKAEKTKEKIQTIKELKESIDSRFSNKSEAYKETLLHYAYTVKDLEGRFNELSSEIQRKTGGAFILTKNNKGEFIENPEPIIEDSKKLSEFINKDGGLQEYEKLVKDYTKRHPEDLDLEEKANDLVKIAQRKKEFLDKYAQGIRTPESLQKKIEELADKITNKAIKKQTALDTFKQAALNKGYSLDRTNNKEGIFITVGGKLMLLKTLNNKQIIVDPISGQILDKQVPLDDYITNSLPYMNVLSREEANEYIKQYKVNQIRSAQLRALEELLNNTKQKGKEVSKEIEAKKQHLNKKIDELRELVDDYYKTNFKDDVFRQDVEKLISEIEEVVSRLQEELQELEKQREYLRNIYTLYQEEKNTLQQNQSEFLDLRGKIITEQSINNLVNEDIIPNVSIEDVEGSIEYLDSLIQQYTNDIKEYETIKNDLQKLLDDDKELRDLILSLNSEDIFNARYSGQIRKEISPRFVKNFLMRQADNLSKYSNEALDRINNVLSKIEENPEYVQDLIALLEQKEKLKELGESIRYTEYNIALVEPEIKKLKQLLKEAEQRKEKLSDIKERLEYKSKGFLNAYIQLRDRAKAYYTRERVEGSIKADNNEIEIKELSDKQNQNLKDLGAKKSDPKSTTGSLIQYDEEHLRKTGEYKDILDDEGNPIYTTSESQLRWGKFLEDNHNELNNGEYQIKYHLHDPNSNSELDVEITNNISRDKLDVGNDLYAVIVDKSGNPVKVNDKYLFSGIHKTETLFPSEGGVRLLRVKDLVANSKLPNAQSLYLVYFEKNETEKLTLNNETKTGKEWLKDSNFENLAQEFIGKVIENEKEKFNNFREQVKKSLQDNKNIFSEITSVSTGIPVINKRIKRSATKLLNKGFELVLSTFKNESGLWVAKTKDGKRIPVETELLKESEAKAVIAILQYAMPKDSNVVVETFKISGDKATKEISVFPTDTKGKNNPSLLGSLIYYGRNKEEPTPYMIWGKQVIQYKDDNELKKVTREQLHNPESTEHKELLAFLQTKRLNISNSWNKSNKYFYEPKVDSKGNLKLEKYSSDEKDKEGGLTGYQKFLKSKLKTRLVEPSENKPLFVNKYLTFKDPVEAKQKPQKEMVETEENYEPSFIPGTDFEIPDDDHLEFQRELLQAKTDGAIKNMDKSSPISAESTEKVDKIETSTNNDESLLNDFLNSGEITSGDFETKERKVNLTKEDAVKRVKELLQEGIIDKKCN